MPDGTTAEAPEATEATYDSVAGKITQSGLDRTAVRITMANSGAITTMTSQRIELEIQPAQVHEQTISAKNPLASNF
jgi:hypothetical protein